MFSKSVYTSGLENVKDIDSSAYFILNFMCCTHVVIRKQWENHQLAFFPQASFFHHTNEPNFSVWYILKILINGILVD